MRRPVKVTEVEHHWPKPALMFHARWSVAGASLALQNVIGRGLTEDQAIEDLMRRTLDDGLRCPEGAS